MHIVYKEILLGTAMRYILNKKLCTFLGKGKEGEVYLTPEGYALKIFFKASKAKTEAELLERAEGSRFFPKILFTTNNIILREYVEGITLKKYIQKNGLSFNVSCEIIDLIEEFYSLKFTRINVRNTHIFINSEEKIKIIDPRKVFIKQTPYPKDIIKVLVNSNTFDTFLKHVFQYKSHLAAYWINGYYYYLTNCKKKFKINMHVG